MSSGMFGAFVDWPDLAELKQVLDVETDVWDGAPDTGMGETRLTRLLDAAISQVKSDVGNWDEDADWPDASLSQAALRMAELLALKPELAAVAARSDPTYMRLMVGKHRRWGIS